MAPLKKPGPGGQGEAEERARRLAQRLKENLGRRKQQSRGRAENEAPETSASSPEIPEKPEN